MITFTEHFKYADVLIVIVGIVTYYAGHRVGRTIPLAGVVGIAIATALGIAILENAREHTDSWREVYVVGAIVMLLTATIGAVIGHVGTRSEKRSTG